jgi:hypothetical protein
MPLRYRLIKNRMKNSNNNYVAVVYDNETITEEQIIDRMISRGSTVTKPDALAVLENYAATLEEFLERGNNIKTRLFNIHPTIGGVFKTKTDNFDPSRHQLRLSIVESKRLKKVLSKIELKRKNISEKTPVIQEVEDLKTNTINSLILSGSVISVRGSLLKFEEDDPEQGVFFIDKKGTVTRANKVLQNKPSELMLITPEDVQGTVIIEIRAVVYKGRYLKKHRFPHKINIVK